MLNIKKAELILDTCEYCNSNVLDECVCMEKGLIEVCVPAIKTSKSEAELAAKVGRDKIRKLFGSN